MLLTDKDRTRQSQLGKKEREQILDHMDLSIQCSSSGNLSQLKSMHVSELMKDTSAQIRSHKLLANLKTELNSENFEIIVLHVLFLHQSVL